MTAALMTIRNQLPPRASRLPRWAWIAIPLAFVNLIAVAVYVAAMLSGSDAVDFATYRLAGERYPSGTLYDVGEPIWYGWRYSPIAVFPLAVAAVVGETAWRLAHLAALAVIPGWTRWIALASFPFWFDVTAGNVMIFILVAAYWALRGNRWAIGAILVTSLLVPRPLMLPLVAWILWKDPEWRTPFVVLFAIHTLAVVATGYADEWIAVLISSSEQVSNTVNIGPSALLGGWWLVAGIPLAAVAFWRGFPATAGVLLQPYWLPYYLLMPLADRLPPTGDDESAEVRAMPSTGVSW